jgi:DNA-directed RNA polymerase subunit L
MQWISDNKLLKLLLLDQYRCEFCRYSLQRPFDHACTLTRLIISSFSEPCEYLRPPGEDE